MKCSWARFWARPSSKPTFLYCSLIQHDALQPFDFHFNFPCHKTLYLFSSRWLQSDGVRSVFIIVKTSLDFKWHKVMSTMRNLVFMPPSHFAKYFTQCQPDKRLGESLLKLYLVFSLLFFHVKVKKLLNTFCMDHITKNNHSLWCPSKQTNTKL